MLLINTYLPPYQYNKWHFLATFGQFFQRSITKARNYSSYYPIIIQTFLGFCISRACKLSLKCPSFHLSPSRLRWFWWMESDANPYCRHYIFNKKLETVRLGRSCHTLSIILWSTESASSLCKTYKDDETDRSTCTIFLFILKMQAFQTM